MDTANKSEIARIRQQIDAEYDATHAGLCGLASGVARHAFIRAKMELLHDYHQELIQLVGEEAADEILCHASDASLERRQLEPYSPAMTTKTSP